MPFLGRMKKLLYISFGNYLIYIVSIIPILLKYHGYIHSLDNIVYCSIYISHSIGILLAIGALLKTIFGVITKQKKQTIFFLICTINFFHFLLVYYTVRMIAV